MVDIEQLGILLDGVRSFISQRIFKKFEIHIPRVKIYIDHLFLYNIA
jgi:hypothetical protein